MNKRNKGLLLLLSSILAIMLVGVVFLIRSPATSASYVDFQSSSNFPRVVAEAKSDRFEAVLACLPKQLGNTSDQDFKERFKQALNEMGNDQLERVFNTKDNPKLSEAEIQFQNCLREKGFIPQP